MFLIVSELPGIIYNNSGFRVLPGKHGATGDIDETEKVISCTTEGCEEIMDFYSLLVISVHTMILVIAIGSLFLSASKGRSSMLRLKIGSSRFLLVDLEIDLKK